VNGAPLVPESADDTGQMILELPAGDSRVEVRFARTSDRTIGGAVSLASIALLGLLLIRGRKPRGLPFS
jgi:hypothetical protein